MAVVELTGRAVTSGRIRFPRLGAWSATLTLDGAEALPVGLRATLSIGGVPFVGTVTVCESDAGNSVTATVLGGAGGLGAAVDSKGYYQTTVGAVVADALSTGGETLSPLSDQTILGSFKAHWTRGAGKVSDAVSAVIGGAVYRVLADSTVWIGTDLFTPAVTTGKLEAEHPNEQRYQVAMKAADILPGQSYQGRDVNEVVYTVDSTSLRASAAYGGASPTGVADLVGALVRRETAALDLHALYVARVVSTNGDSTVDLIPDDTRIPHLAHVPLRIAGVSSITLLPSTKVLLAHENGDPSKPVVAGIYSGPVQSIATTAIESITMTAPLVKAGGELDLVLHIPLVAWVAQLTTAALPIGLTVPPLVAANTTITKGA